MSGDVRFAFNGNWAADGFKTSWTGVWRAVGELGSATWDGEGAPEVESGPTQKIRAAAPAQVPIPTRSASSGSRPRWPTLSRRCAPGGVPLGECHDNLRSIAMCHAAVESAALGAPVPVP